MNDENNIPKRVSDEVLNHLLFHKSLIGEKDEGERINKYMEMVKCLENDYASIKSQFDREIMVMFELVIEQRLDPWDVDLVKFSKLYMKRVRKEKNLNLVTAGYIVLTAWTILKLQSDKLLELSLQSDETEELSWDVIPDWFVEDDRYDYTAAVLHGEAPIEERIRRKGDRKVTLFELVEAFNEAKNNVRLRELMSENRKKQRIIYEKNDLKNIGEKIHKENMEEDMGIVWGRISEFDGKPIPLSNICNGKKEDFVMTVLSVLFLANSKRLRVWQKRFPYGEIYVQRCET
ncbi:MAG: segregation/condensation protein A [Candidatus Thermoplasmatota archaeon]|nr:segregation/condensation protein A [Candidatus Thermoplasmatota archaeon]